MNAGCRGGSALLGATGDSYLRRTSVPSTYIRQTQKEFLEAGPVDPDVSHWTLAYSQTLQFWLPQLDELLHPLQFKGKRINPKTISPTAERFERPPTPHRKAHILNCRPPRGDNEFEIVDKAFCGGAQPRCLGIFLGRESLPSIGCPFVRSSWKVDCVFNIAIHTSPLWDWSVVLDHNF